MSDLLPSQESWNSGSGNAVMFKDIIESIKNKDGMEIHVGSDSQIIKEKVSFAVAVCLISPGSGGIFYVKRFSQPAQRYSQLGYRLQQEVNYSIDIAQKIKDACKDRNISIHLDVNKRHECKSGKYAKQLSSYVEAMGFKFFLKPESWASGTVADRHTK